MPTEGRAPPSSWPGARTDWIWKPPPVSAVSTSSSASSTQTAGSPRVPRSRRNGSTSASGVFRSRKRFDRTPRCGRRSSRSDTLFSHMATGKAGEFQRLNEEVREIWDKNADYWNERMGDGNEFHRTLIGPAQERLLDLQPGETVLDIGCGNGQFARRMV